MRHIFSIAILLIFIGFPAYGLDSRAYVEKAVDLIENGEFGLARSYLNPALIDYRLSPPERSRAYYLRGYSYFAQALFVSASKDYARALEFNPENPAALVAMAGLQFYGQGVTQDDDLGFQMFLQAIEASKDAQPHPSALFHVGIAYLEGRGVAKNITEARVWLEKAAADNGALAMTHLARSYRAEVTDHPDPDIAKDWYLKSHEAGNTDALLALAFMHQNGEFGEPDPKEALALFKQAADEGSANGKVNLGHQYLTGTLLPEDPNRAIQLFTEAAAQGLPSAFFRLGYVYDYGLGVSADPVLARQWYGKAADAGLLSAQLRLVYLLLSDNAPESVAEATQWLAQAASADHPQAHNDYAWLLATSKHAGVRNGELALTHAQRAVAKEATPAYLDTLAAAYAELGLFDEAVDTQQRALETFEQYANQQSDVSAEINVDPEFATELNQHLEAYRSGKAWRE